jgi:glycosyltransferase involved in cell wall biosynthesis
MLKDGKDYRFKWIGDLGDDEESKTVLNLLERSGNPQQIEITGWVQKPETHLETLDVFCMFSRYESFGYVTAEAMLLGVPVLATRSTGTIDLVRHEETGLLAEPKVKTIVSSIRLLQADVSLRARLTSNARQFIMENHTVAKLMEALENLYLKCASKGNLRVVHRATSFASNEVSDSNQKN